MKTLPHDLVGWFLDQHSWVQRSIAISWIVLGWLFSDDWPKGGIAAIVLGLMLLVAEFVDPEGPW